MAPEGAACILNGYVVCLRSPLSIGVMRDFARPGSIGDTGAFCFGPPPLAASCPAPITRSV
jgi:hypothetical protein